jgi:hypothetical protein
MRGAIALSLALMLCGFVTTLPDLTPDQVQAMPDTEALCERFHTLHKMNLPNAQKDMAVIRAELIRRGATSQSEWDLTDAGKIQTGMHKCIVFALFGAPTTISMSGPVNLYQFPAGDIVIFQSGAVTSFTIVSLPHPS